MSLTPAARSPAPRFGPRIALVLGGGGARGLAHIGVLDVLARAGIPIHFIAGSSMGGLIGGLHASGLSAGEMVAVARRFRFPRWFLPGGLLEWTSLFPSAPAHLAERFEDLSPPLAIAALDLEEGAQVVLHRGPVLPAVRATCAVPGILPPVRLNGRWLVDGGVINGLPTDVAWMANPDIVIAVRVGASRIRRIPELQWRVTSLVSRLGRFIPNPATAKVSLEVLTRTAEVMLERQTALTAAMADPEILIEPELGDLGLRDFQRLDEAVAAGRRAAAEALPGIEYLLALPSYPRASEDRSVSLHFDPVCGMAVNPARARASRAHGGTTFFFCSSNCLDCFVRAPARYLEQARLAFMPPAGGSQGNAVSSVGGGGRGKPAS